MHPFRRRVGRRGRGSSLSPVHVSMIGDSAEGGSIKGAPSVPARASPVRLGSHGMFPGGLWGVHGISVDQDGNLYTADVDNGRVQEFAPKTGANPDFLVAKPIYSAWKGTATGLLNVRAGTKPESKDRRHGCEHSRRNQLPGQEASRWRHKAPLCGRCGSGRARYRRPIRVRLYRGTGRRERRCGSRKTGIRQRDLFHFLAFGSCDPPHENWSPGGSDNTTYPVPCL